MARTDYAVRRATLEQVPPRKCSARSSQTGEPCKRFSCVGSVVCHAHGGRAPQVRAAAARRLTLAEALANGDKRSAAEVLLDHQHTLDHIARDFKIKVADGGDPVDVAMLAQLVEATKSSAQMSKAVLDLGLDASSLTAEQSAQLTYVIGVAMAALGRPLSEPRVARAVSAALRAVDALGPVAADRRQAISEATAQVQAGLAQRKAVDDTQVQARVDAATASQLADLRQAARHRPCRVCGTPPAGQGQQRAIEAPPAPRRTQQADGPASPAPEPDDVLVGELIDSPRVLPRWPICTGCGRVADPSHDASCGYASPTGGWR